MPSQKLVKEPAAVRRKAEMKCALDKIVDTMKLPECILEVAMELYAAADAKEVPMRGVEKESMAAAMLLIVCRQRRLSRSFKEFEEATGIEKKRISKSFLKLTKVLDINMAPVKGEDFVNRFCSELRLPSQLQLSAYAAVQNVSKYDLALGKSPIAVAAAVIFFVAYDGGAERSLAEISGVSKISVKIIKAVCNELNKRRTKLFEGVRLA